jgi:hypothetical protein
MLNVDQAVSNRITPAGTPQEQAAVLRGIPCVDTAALEDGEAVRLWRETGGPPGTTDRRRPGRGRGARARIPHRPPSRRRPAHVQARP